MVLVGGHASQIHGLQYFSHQPNSCSFRFLEFHDFQLDLGTDKQTLSSLMVLGLRTVG